MGMEKDALITEFLEQYGIKVIKKFTENKVIGPFTLS